VDTERWKHVERVFFEALECAAPEREAYLAQACGDDALLLDEVRAMLTASIDESPFKIEERLRAETVAPPPSAPDGGQLGPYRIMELLGHGGMGSVWLASQDEPIRRQVAIKVLKTGLDADEFGVRFASERRALERMEHPGIARIFDAGTTADGRPWFAMERVRGAALTRFCDEQQLSVTERLELFLRVCDAVQYAHQRGIIHRDLKPSNILVSSAGSSPRPTIIDFGIAKAVGEDADASHPTRTGLALGTPAYMSPEQAERSVHGVDIRTDVYSLGVVLYTLLVGVLPVDTTVPGASSWKDARERGLPRPSVRLAKLGETQVTLARDRGESLDGLCRRLAGELDWIVLRALETDPERRYPTVERFADDIRRHLRDEPVEARPPTLGYRTSKFIRRHRWGVLAAGVAVVALAGGGALATAGMLAARRAEARAVADADEARSIRDFLIDIFEVNDPSEARGTRVTARELLDRGAEQIRFELSDQPLAQADLMSAIGSAYASLGLYGQADSLLSRVVDVRRQALSSQDPDRVRALVDLGGLRYRQAEFVEAVVLGEEALAAAEASSTADPTLTADALDLLSTSNAALDELALAHDYALRAYDLRSGEEEPDPLGVAASLQRLAIVAGFRQDTQANLEYAERALAVAQAGVGDEHPTTLDILESTALALSNVGEQDSALVVHERVLEGRRRLFDPDHPTVAYSYFNLGRTLSQMGRRGEAIPMLERAIAIREQALGPNDPNVAFVIETLAIATAMNGDLDGAAGLFARAVGIFEAGLGPQHSETLEARINLAELTWYAQGVEPGFERLQQAVNQIPVDSEIGAFFLGRISGTPFNGLEGDSRYEALVQRVQAIADGGSGA